MTTIVNWQDRDVSVQPVWHTWQRRLTVSLRLWQRRMARRRFVNRVLAETRDPALLEDVGIRPQGQGHTERWIAAMLWHQH